MRLCGNDQTHRKSPTRKVKTGTISAWVRCCPGSRLHKLVLHTKIGAQWKGKNRRRAKKPRPGSVCVCAEIVEKVKQRVLQVVVLWRVFLKFENSACICMKRLNCREVQIFLLLLLQPFALTVFTIILIKLLIKTLWLKCSRYLLMKCVVISYSYFIRNYQVWKYMWISSGLCRASIYLFIYFFKKERVKKREKIKSYSASIDLPPAAFLCWRLTVGCWFWLAAFFRCWFL